MFYGRHTTAETQNIFGAVLLSKLRALNVISQEGKTTGHIGKGFFVSTRTTANGKRTSDYVSIRAYTTFCPALPRALAVLGRVGSREKKEEKGGMGKKRGEGRERKRKRWVKEEKGMEDGKGSANGKRLEAFPEIMDPIYCCRQKNT